MCRDSKDMQYNKLSQNLQKGKLVSLYVNLLFIFECFITYNTPRVAHLSSDTITRTVRYLSAITR